MQLLVSETSFTQCITVPVPSVSLKATPTSLRTIQNHASYIVGSLPASYFAILLISSSPFLTKTREISFAGLTEHHVHSGLLVNFEEANSLHLRSWSNA